MRLLFQWYLFVYFLVCLCQSDNALTSLFIHKSWWKIVDSIKVEPEDFVNCHTQTDCLTDETQVTHDKVVIWTDMPVLLDRNTRASTYHLRRGWKTWSSKNHERCQNVRYEISYFSGERGRGSSFHFRYNSLNATKRMVEVIFRIVMRPSSPVILICWDTLITRM